MLETPQILWVQAQQAAVIPSKIPHGDKSNAFGPAVAELVAAIAALL